MFVPGVKTIGRNGNRCISLKMKDVANNCLVTVLVRMVKCVNGKDDITELLGM